jgi:hypothetical protein
VTQHKPTHFQWINIIIENRPNFNNENVEGLTVNDARNGMLVNANAHSFLEARRAAFLKVSIRN